MPAPEPQAILTPLTEAAIFLTVEVDAGGEEPVRGLLGDVSGLKRSVGFRIPEGELTCVVGIGASAWERLFGSGGPSELHPFREIRGARHDAPSTPGDLLFHIRARRLDLCFELAQRVTERLRGCGRVIDEVHGFRSFDERDLLGFVDGTENPDGQEARDAVVIGARGRRLRRRQLRDRPEVRPRPAGLGHARRIRAGADHRTHEAQRPRVPGRREGHQLARGAQHDRRRGRHGAQNHAFQHALREGRGGRVRDLLHRLRSQPRRDRADAAEHVHRQARGQLRPHPGLLHGHDREPVLRAVRRVHGRPPGALAGGGGRHRRGAGRDRARQRRMGRWRSAASGRTAREPSPAGPCADQRRGLADARQRGQGAARPGARRSPAGGLLRTPRVGALRHQPGPRGSAERSTRERDRGGPAAGAAARRAASRLRASPRGAEGRRPRRR